MGFLLQNHKNQQVTWNIHINSPGIVIPTKIHFTPFLSRRVTIETPHLIGATIDAHVLHRSWCAVAIICTRSFHLICLFDVDNLVLAVWTDWLYPSETQSVQEPWREGWGCATDSRCISQWAHPCSLWNKFLICLPYWSILGFLITGLCFLNFDYVQFVYVWWLTLIISVTGSKSPRRPTSGHVCEGVSRLG